MSLLPRFLIRCQQRVPGYRGALALIFGFGRHRAKEGTVMSWKPRLGRNRKTLRSYLGNSSSLLVFRNIHFWFLSVKSRYLIHFIYWYLLLCYLLLEALLICVFVILLYCLTSRLSLEILLSIILSLLDFHMCNFTCCWKRWASRPSWNLRYDLFLGRLTCWSLEWTRLCQFLSAWRFPIALNYMLSLRSGRSCCTWTAGEDASSIKTFSHLLLMDHLFPHLERLIFIAITNCKVRLTSIKTNATHLGIACFLDLAHWTNSSVLFEVTVVSVVKESFLSDMSYWFVDRFLFNQLGNLWLMSYNIR